MSQRTDDASHQQTLAVTLYPSPISDVFAAVRFQTNLHGVVNVATCIGLGTAVVYAFTAHYRTALPAISVIVDALFWGTVGYVLVLGVLMLVVFMRHRGFVLVLRDSGLTFVHSSAPMRSYLWRDVDNVWSVDDLVLILIHGEALFVSSLWDVSPSNRRRVRQMLVRHLNLSLNASMFAPEREH